MEELLKDQITKLIEDLKPEICQRATFNFGDYKIEENKLVLADTSYMTKPPVITFYLQSIEKINPNENTLKEIISHEIIHTFSKNERDAYSKQNKMNIFKVN
jgi:predicted Zn-dependent protease with MMP-like domain